MKALDSDTLGDDAAIIADLSDAYGDLLNLDGSTLSDSFLTSADNLNLMKAAIDGDIDAYNQLMDLAQQDIAAQIHLDTTEFENNFNDLLSQYYDAQNLDDLEIGASLNNDAFLQGLSDMVTAAGMTADQATSYLASMGVDAEVTETTTDDTESNEIAGYTGEAVEVTGKVHFPTVSASSTEDGGYVVEQGQSIDDTWQYDGLKVTPNNETVDAKKQNKSFALKVTSANKSSGGGFKYSQARNGGGSGGAARRASSGGGGGRKGGGGGKKGGGGGKKGGGGGKGKKGSGSGK